MSKKESLYKEHGRAAARMGMSLTDNPYKGFVGSAWKREHWNLGFNAEKEVMRKEAAEFEEQERARRYRAYERETKWSPVTDELDRLEIEPVIGIAELRRVVEAIIDVLEEEEE